MSSFRRRLMMAQGGGGGGSVPGVKESEAGDICVYDVNKGSLAIIKAAEWSASAYPIDTYVPVGVVVVPASHNHYRNGKCSIISIPHMLCDNPTQGGDDPNTLEAQTIVFGNNITGIQNFNEMPYIGQNGNVTNEVIGITNQALLAHQNDSNQVQNPYDENTGYYDRDSKYVASPYNNDGTFNPNYSLTTSPSSTSNCLSDFDGYNNTKKIIEVRGAKDYSSWKPTKNNQADYPAASCCDMYFTQGTKQGDWYLPSAGEFGYWLARTDIINNSLEKLGGYNAGIQFGAYNTSTISSQTQHIIIYNYNANVQSFRNSGGSYTKAFLLV